MRCAVVNNSTNKITNIIIADPEVDTVPNGFRLVAIDSNVQGNWVWNGSTFEDPNPPVPPTFEQLKEIKLSSLANIRWAKETGGTTFNGMPLATDLTSQTKYVGAVVAAQISPLMTLKWKLSNGTFVDLDAAAITQVAMAVRAHIQACFDKEAELQALIEAAVDQTELDAIDITVGWP